MTFKQLGRKYPDWIIAMKGSGRAIIAYCIDPRRMVIRAEVARTPLELDIILKREEAR